LHQQLEQMRPRVAEAEAQVEKYRLEHYGSLPDQLDANLRVLDETEMSHNALLNSLDAAQARRRDILAEARSPLRHQEETVARELSAARTRYAADAPEVKALERELARVREERHSDEGDAAKRIASSRELRTVDEQIARLQVQITDLRARSGGLRKRVDEAARHGEVLARMSVERDVLRERLRSLVAKHEDAALASGLEAGITGRARLAIVEPAWSSAEPVKPSKPLFAMIALLCAAALGLGVGWIIDTLDRRILAAEDVRVLTGDLPILAVVPSFKARAATAARSAR
jgi:polysaccharide biosynthesis transport protein